MSSDQFNVFYFGSSTSYKREPNYFDQSVLFPCSFRRYNGGDLHNSIYFLILTREYLHEFSQTNRYSSRSSSTRINCILFHSLFSISVEQRYFFFISTYCCRGIAGVIRSFFLSCCRYPSYLQKECHELSRFLFWRF